MPDGLTSLEPFPGYSVCGPSSCCPLNLLQINIWNLSFPNPNERKETTPLPPSPRRLPSIDDWWWRVHICLGVRAHEIFKSHSSFRSYHRAPFEFCITARQRQVPIFLYNLLRTISEHDTVRGHCEMRSWYNSRLVIWIEDLRWIESIGGACLFTFWCAGAVPKAKQAGRLLVLWGRREEPGGPEGESEVDPPPLVLRTKSGKSIYLKASNRSITWTSLWKPHPTYLEVKK